ncbi:MAG: murein hydrolase activator EnvC family protein [Steroidobacteraceae bacterium]
MKPVFRSLCMCAALLCASGRGAPAEPADQAHADAAKARLAAVRARIAELTNRIGAELKQRDALSARVRDADLAIAAERQRVDALHAAALAAERHRSELRAEQARDQNALREERAALAAQLRQAYMLGRRDALELLLNQSNPAGFGRTLAYHGYFAQQRSEKIAAIQGDERRLQQLVVQIEQQGQKLQALETEANREIAGLQSARAERSAAVAALTKILASGNQQLGGLQREERAVESLVEELALLMQDFPVDATQSFVAMRGRLPWPVPGRVSARYRSARDNSAGVRWNGVMIDAARGAKVRAPFYGRVVYADWLQGLGLLLIIGHSGGYMTLYGHAEVLYKSVGDWVAPGDVIAGLSDSEGAAPALYFEIREGRKTLDPKDWLRANQQP